MGSWSGSPRSAGNHLETYAHRPDAPRGRVRHARRMPTDRYRVLIGGGGVAALEALLGLGELAGDRVDVELITPRDTYVDRPLAVAEPFGATKAQSFELRDIAEDRGARLRLDGLEEVDPGARRVITHSGAELEYDEL